MTAPDVSSAPGSRGDRCGSSPTASPGTGSAALRDRPSKLFVEITTRCNLGCTMCVKQSCDHAIVEGDMPLATFDGLEAAFPGLEALILNGVGEALLHPHLAEFIRRAKALMPKSGWIGFQSNGLLLNAPLAVALLEAGLDKICLSIDSASPEIFRRVRQGGELDDIDDAFSALAAAKLHTGRADFQIGVEFVAMESNLHELPDALAWAAGRGASFALVTHVLPYDSSTADEALYGDCSGDALELFDRWRAQADREGLDIYRYFKVVMKYTKNAEEQRMVDLVEAMKAEAERRGLFLGLKRLLQFDHGKLAGVEAVFEKARQVAAGLGLDLRLPGSVLKEERSCEFVEEGGAFIAFNGTVSPCYFLWHRYRCFASGWEQQVQPKVFGNVNEEGILDIWNSQAFRSFREGVVAYDYPHCTSCSLAPCDYVQNDSFEQDCHIRDVPCGACLWCTGIFQCLK